MTLTSAEIGRIEHGLLDIQQIGPDMTTPFIANKLVDANVVWINERWFLERGIDVTDAAVRQRLDQWLIDEHAYIVPVAGRASEVAPQTKTFVADLYGTSEMAIHGGSGRVGITGRLQVKGLGRTPLVGTAVDWLHSHGCLWLEEALREAVYAEAMAAEFPHGTVPVLAVINSGLRHPLETGEVSERRALSIRPVVARPAYFERAVLFQPPGREHEARRRDVRRVRQVVGHFERMAPEADARTLRERLARTFTHLAQQIAFSRAHRLFPGNYASSNIDMNGALLDFGAFRALPNWCRYISMNDVEGFGNELPEASAAIRSIAFYVNKYKAADTEGIEAEELLDSFKEELNRACVREFLHLFHLDDVADDNLKRLASAIMFAYYGMQQRFEVRYQNGIKKKLDWLADVLTDVGSEQDPLHKERAVLKDLSDAIRTSQLTPTERDLLCQRVWASAARLLPMRRELLRDVLINTIHALIAASDTGATLSATRIQAGIDGVIHRNRRHWPRVPRHLVVLAQFVNARCAVLYCLNPEGGKHYIWLETISLDGHMWCVDRWVEQAVMQPYQYRQEQARWYGLFPANGTGAALVPRGVDLRMPEEAIWFDVASYCTSDKSLECVGT